MLHSYSYCFLDERKSLCYLPCQSYFSYSPCHEQKLLRNFNTSNIYKKPSNSLTDHVSVILKIQALPVETFCFKQVTILNTQQSDLDCAMNWQCKRRCQILYKQAQRIVYDGSVVSDSLLSAVRAERASRELLGYVEYISSVTTLQLHICTFSKRGGEWWPCQKTTLSLRTPAADWPICFLLLWTVCWMF